MLHARPRRRATTTGGGNLEALGHLRGVGPHALRELGVVRALGELLEDGGGDALGRAALAEDGRVAHGQRVAVGRRDVVHRRLAALEEHDQAVLAHLRRRGGGELDDLALGLLRDRGDVLRHLGALQVRVLDRGHHGLDAQAADLDVPRAVELVEGEHAHERRQVLRRQRLGAVELRQALLLAPRRREERQRPKHVAVRPARGLALGQQLAEARHGRALARAAQAAEHDDAARVHGVAHVAHDDVADVVGRLAEDVDGHVGRRRLELRQHALGDGRVDALLELLRVLGVAADDGLALELAQRRKFSVALEEPDDGRAGLGVLLL